jgi:transcriptional regulator with XRE-family HTH domain
MDENTLYRLIGERIRDRRGDIKLSQEKLALQLNMSRTSIVNIEAGRQRAPVHVLWQIAEKLRTDLGLLIPKATEYIDQTAPVKLDSGTVAEIEKAANGDPVTKRQLISFIAKTRS